MSPNGEGVAMGDTVVAVAETDVVAMIREIDMIEAMQAPAGMPGDPALEKFEDWRSTTVLDRLGRLQRAAVPNLAATVALMRFSLRRLDVEIAGQPEGKILGHAVDELARLAGVVVA